MARIHIPTPLRAFTGSAATVTVAGATVGEALGDLTTQHPGLAKHLRDGDGKLRSFVNIYVGDEDIRFLDREATAIGADAELTIVPSIAGGAQ
jgi:molybdopterin converting factor small subunit